MRFIPMMVLTGAFTAIGLYLTILTQHFIEWTRKYNEMIHREIDSHLPHPVFVPRANANYARMQENGRMLLFTWMVRLTGVALVGYSLVIFCEIVCFGM